MLVKQGFNVKVGRILNPTAVFCNERNEYYNSLAKADSGDQKSLLGWCQYVLSGLKREIEKIDNLLDHDFLLQKILIPAIEVSLERQLITETETKILMVAAERQIFQAGDVKNIFPKKIPQEISRILRGLREKKMIVSVDPGARKYYINFHNNYLLRGIIMMLDRNGFLPTKSISTSEI
jgi:Fic family protein